MPDGAGGEAFRRRGAALTWKVIDYARAREELPDPSRVLYFGEDTPGVFRD
jgi:hypothetical protein